MDREGGSRMPLVRAAASRVDELEAANIYQPSNTTVYESSGNGPDRRLVIPATGAAPDAVALIRAMGQGQGGVIMNLAPRIVNLGHIEQKVVRAKGATGVVLMNTGEVVGNDGKMNQTVYEGVEPGATTADDPTEQDNFLWNLFFGKPGQSKPGLGCYKLEGKACALIINNVFNNPKKKNVPDYNEHVRRGAEGDSRKMEDLFMDWLEFDFVDKEKNVESEKLSGILTEFRKKAHKRKCSSCFIVIMSHGGEQADSIAMDDMKEVDLYQDIVYPFSDHNDFRDKPKIFIVQACRNSRKAPERREQDSHRKIQDVLIAHSTIPHETADRTASLGAFYISEIDKTFRKHARREPLDKMLYLVFKELQRVYDQNSNYQNIGFGEYRFKFEDLPEETTDELEQH